MKKNLIIVFSCIFLLAGCGQINIPQILNNNNLNISSNLNVASITPEQQNQNLNTVPPAESEVKIDKIWLSDVYKKDGTVEESKTSFKSTTAEIAASAYILGSQPGMTVVAQLQFLPTKEIVGPVINNVDIKGDVISNFLFTKPVSDWPTGEYQITISVNYKVTQTVNFTIEE